MCDDNFGANDQVANVEDRDIPEADRQHVVQQQSVAISDKGRQRLERCLEQIALVENHKKRVSEDERGEIYIELGETAAAFQQAKYFWFENPDASRGENEARLSFARFALNCGDLGLCRAQLVRTSVSGYRKHRLIEQFEAARIEAKCKKESGGEPKAEDVKKTTTSTAAEMKDSAASAKAKTAGSQIVDSDPCQFANLDQFRSVVLKTLVFMMLADDVIDPREQASIIQIFGEFGQVVDNDTLEMEIEGASKNLQDPISYLRKAYAKVEINEQEKAVLLKSAYKVALADGDFDESERALLTRMALILGVSLEELGGILELEEDNPAVGLDDSTRKAIFLRTMVLIMMADGVAAPTEQKRVKKVYSQLTGAELSQLELDTDILAVQESNNDPVAYLKLHALYLHQIDKELLLRAGCQIGYSDGEFQQAERDLMTKIALTLGIPINQLSAIMS
jgi:tellurite resistance protein